MKPDLTFKIRVFSLLLSAFCFHLSAFGQGTAFTYQGRLNNGPNPAAGTYDLTFALFDSASGGSQQGNMFTNSATVVSNGLFTVTLNFGNQFSGAARWLEIGVRTNGTSSPGFSTLSPRQLLTPTPYAIQAGNAASAGVAASANSVAAANVSGTLSTTQLPPGIVTNGANGLTLSGTFIGNGTGLTNVPGTTPWQVASSTNIIATANRGYVLTNNSLTTVTLPTSANIGDVVTISGQLFAGYSRQVSAPWTGQNSGVQNLNGLAASADGMKLVAVGRPGQLSTSTDGGATWIPRSVGLPPSFNQWWGAVASSADGTKLVAAIDGGSIYTSTDSGASWTERTNTYPAAPFPSGPSWRSLASSADGTKLIAAHSPGLIYASTNSGLNWFVQTNGLPGTNQGWVALASSADGTKLVAVPGIGNSPIYTSTNSGATWAAQLPPTYIAWACVASSADGSKLALGANGYPIYTSADFGVTWTPQNNTTNLYWHAITMSADGSKLLACAFAIGPYPGIVAVSIDSGVNWTLQTNGLPNGGSANWYVVASSTDGSRLVVGAFAGTGPIYTSTGGPVFQGSAPGALTSFQYLGNGIWQLTTGNASQLSQTIQFSQLPPGILTNGANNVSISGAFTGNGFGLTNVPIASLVQQQSALVLWGSTNHGITAVPPNAGSISAISVGIYHALALRSNGTVIAWGAGLTNDPTNGFDFGQAIVPPGLSNVTAVSAGAGYSLALKQDGTVVLWGADVFSIGITNIPPGLSNVAAISAGIEVAAALKNNGTVVAWGDNTYGETNVPAELSNVVAVSAGGAHVLALMPSGTVVAWGLGSSNGPYGQATVPPGLSNVIAISAGYLHSLALKSDGTVVAWGAGLTNDPNVFYNAGQSIVPPGLSNVVAIAAGELHSLALKSDGTVAAWGAGLTNNPNDVNNAGQSIVPPGLGNVIAISAGGVNSAALRLPQWVSAQVPTLTGNNVFQGSITATGFAGDGSGLVNLNASQLTSGLVPSTVIGGTYSNAVHFDNPDDTYRGHDFTGFNIIGNNILGGTISGSTFSGGSFTGDGSGLSNLNANAFATGTVPDARLSSNVPLLSAGKLGDSVLSANVALLNLNQTFSTGKGISAQNTLEFGAGITNKEPNAGKIGYQTFTPDSLDIVGAGTNGASRKIQFWNEGGANFAGQVSAPSFAGAGTNLTLSASQLTSGTLPDIRLSTNVALRSTSNTFNGTQIITNGNLGIANTSPGFPLTFSQGLGDKLALYPSISGSSYGFGIQSFLLQIHSDTSAADIAFGSGSSSNLLETMRIKGNGHVGLGTTNPGLNILQINQTNVTANGYGLVVSKADYGEEIQINRGPAGGGIGLVLDNAANGDATTSMLLIRNNMTNSGQTLMNVQADGKVGIGTASPQKLLQVGDAGTGGSEGMIHFASRSASGVAARDWDIGVPQTTNDTSGVGYSFIIHDNGMPSQAAQLMVQFGTGNVGIGTATPTNRLHVIGGATFSSGAAGANQNVVWVPGSASWSFTSDRNAKDRVDPVNTQSVLDKVARLSINEWSYIGYDQRHIGPMAQDFHEQFPLNENDKALNDADLHGVALAAIQGLNQKVEGRSEKQDIRMRKLEAENAELKLELAELRKLVQAMNAK